MKVHYALAAMAASASALIAPAAMPRALVARPAPTADATVLEVPRPRPLFDKVLRHVSCGWIASPTIRLHPRANSRATCIRGRVGLSSMMNQEGVGFKPQSLRRRGFEPHRMHVLTDWRSGSASDSSPPEENHREAQRRRYDTQVLPLHGQDRLARRQARRLRLRHQGHGGRQGHRGRRLPVRPDLEACDHR